MFAGRVRGRRGADSDWECGDEMVVEVIGCGREVGLRLGAPFHVFFVFCKANP